jgi:hypothetical protein
MRGTSHTVSDSASMKSRRLVRGADPVFDDADIGNVDARGLDSGSTSTVGRRAAGSDQPHESAAIKGSNAALPGQMQPHVDLGAHTERVQLTPLRRGSLLDPQPGVPRISRGGALVTRHHDAPVDAQRPSSVMLDPMSDIGRGGAAAAAALFGATAPLGSNRPKLTPIRRPSGTVVQMPSPATGAHHRQVADALSPSLVAWTGQDTASSALEHYLGGSPVDAKANSLEK